MAEYAQPPSHARDTALPQTRKRDAPCGPSALMSNPVCRTLCGYTLETVEYMGCRHGVTLQHTVSGPLEQGASYPT